MKALAYFCAVNLISNQANTDEMLDANEELERLVSVIREIEF